MPEKLDMSLIRHTPPLAAYRAIPKTAIKAPARTGMPNSRAMRSGAAAGDDDAALLPSDVCEGEEPEVDEGVREVVLPVDEGSSPLAVKLPHLSFLVCSQPYRSEASSPEASTHFSYQNRHSRPGTVCSYLDRSGSVPFLHLHVVSSVVWGHAS
jgi:hypothetical protein